MPGILQEKINYGTFNTLAVHGLEKPCASVPDFCDNRQFHVIRSHLNPLFFGHLTFFWSLCFHVC